MQQLMEMGVVSSLEGDTDEGWSNGPATEEMLTRYDQDGFIN
jgi:hypothetical protein